MRQGSLGRHLYFLKGRKRRSGYSQFAEILKAAPVLNSKESIQWPARLYRPA